MGFFLTEMFRGTIDLVAIFNGSLWFPLEAFRSRIRLSLAVAAMSQATTTTTTRPHSAQPSLNPQNLTDPLSFGNPTSVRIPVLRIVFIIIIIDIIITINRLYRMYSM